MATALKWVDSLREVLTENELRWLAGEQALQAGRTLAAQEKVQLTDVTAVTLDAVVSAEQKFSVSINLMHDCDLQYQCNCSAGAGEIFCLHCVAAAVCWLSGSYDVDYRLAAKPAEPDTPDAGLIIAELRKRLESMDKLSLVELILNWVDQDLELATHLSSLLTLGCSAETLAAEIQLASIKETEEQ